MHYCKNCQKPVAKDSGPCPHCGREISGSVPAADGSRPGSTRGAQGQQRTFDPSTGEVSDGSAHEAGSFADRDEEGDSPIELGIDVDSERFRKAGPRTGQSGAGDAPGGAATPPPAIMPGSDDVARIAGYGDPPDAFLQAVPYMLAVRKRRTVLASEIAAQEKVHEEARGDLEAELLSVGSRKLAECRGTDEQEKLVASIDEASKDVSRLRGERQAEDDEFKAKAGYVDEELSKLRTDAEKLKSEESIRERDAEEARSAARRVRLKVQRIDIEVRNIRDAIPRPQKGAPPPDPAVVAGHEARMGVLEGNRREVQAELDQAEEKVKGIERKLAIARSALSERMGKVAMADRRRDDLVSHRQASDTEMQKRFYDRQKAYEDLVRELGMREFKEGKLPSGSEGAQEILARKIEREAQASAKLDLLGKAFASYSTTVYMRGWYVLGAGAALFVLLLVTLVALLV